MSTQDLSLKSTGSPVPPRGVRRLRYSLAGLMAGAACFIIVVSHINTSIRLRQAEQSVAAQQAELARLRDELGIFDVEDPTQVHSVFVRQMEDKAWRWRVYLPPRGRYMFKWATDEIPGEGLSFQWEGQEFQPALQDPTGFNVDVFLRNDARGVPHWFVRYPWGEFKRAIPEGMSPLSPQEPVGIAGDPHFRPGHLIVSDPKQPVVLFRMQMIPEAEAKAAQVKGGGDIDGTFPGIMVWIEPAK
jgi:hypothetical protein